MSDISTPLLDKVQFPADLRAFPEQALSQLSKELRQEMIRAVSMTGGHLGAGLGVVELTIALHYIFNTPDDRIIWDVGHQAYPHKILTGRRHLMGSLRQKNGLSGFTKRSESIYDPFGAGHSSTSISAGLGMAVAAGLKAEKDRIVISVIGDGAMSAGMAYEAMNNAAAHKTRLIVILNDNDMSIAPPTGAMSAYLAKLASSPGFRSLRDKAKELSLKMPRFVLDKLRRSEEYARGFLTGGTLFEELGFYYVGPIDGHNFEHLLPIFKNIRDHPQGPVLVHVVTHKGKGYPPAEAAFDKYHGVERFDIATGAPLKVVKEPPSYTKIFARALIEEAKQDDKIVAITAAMPSGTGLDLFAKCYPKRMFDVGIAEQHAVTFAAGLACEGYKPFVAIYSTFLQRAYDQIVHDVSLQKLPVRFAIDRAGFVGADGATHAGSFDTSFLINLPGFVVMAPSDETELQNMVRTAANYQDGPISFRYPRAAGRFYPEKSRGEILEIGKGRLLKTGNKIALIGFGTMVQEALKAAEILESQNLSITVMDARFAKPLDKDLVRQLAKEHEILLTIEEGAIGGFGTHVLHFLVQEGLIYPHLKIRTLTLPDIYLEQGIQKEVLQDIGLDNKGIVKAVLDLI